MEEIIAIHDRVLEAIGGLYGIREIGLLFSLVERPKTTIMSQEMYEGLCLKAAVYLESITNYHVFLDGNKRTAFLVTANFLRANGYTLDVSHDSAFHCMQKVAIKKKNIKQIAAWLQKYSKPLV